jgi:short-subunit dehydrogenase
MTSLKPVVLITGASAGIGVALAHEFVRHGHALALTARRADRLDALADAIAAAGRERPLTIVADLQKQDAAKEIADALAAAGAEPKVVVNNAGFGLVGRATELSRDEQLEMIDLNIRVLTDLSVRFTESLARHKGGVLNVASVAAFLPGPGMAVYYATKAYVLSFSRALREEMRPLGISVTVLCPGPVPTEFAKRAGVRSGSIAPSLLVKTAERVAADGYRGFMAGKAVVVPGALNRLITMLLPFIPASMVLGVVGCRQAARRAARRV